MIGSKLILAIFIGARFANGYKNRDNKDDGEYCDRHNCYDFNEDEDDSFWRPTLTHVVTEYVAPACAEIVPPAVTAECSPTTVELATTVPVYYTQSTVTTISGTVTTIYNTVTSSLTFTSEITLPALIVPVPITVTPPPVTVTPPPAAPPPETATATATVTELSPPTALPPAIYDTGSGTCYDARGVLGSAIVFDTVLEVHGGNQLTPDQCYNYCKYSQFYNGESPWYFGLRSDMTIRVGNQQVKADECDCLIQPPDDLADNCAVANGQMYGSGTPPYSLWVYTAP